MRSQGLPTAKLPGTLARGGLMHGFRPVIRWIVYLCAVLLVFPAIGAGQSPTTASQASQTNVVAKEEKPSLSVMVRSPNGTPLNTMAVITLYDASGQAITSKTTS